MKSTNQLIEELKKLRKESERCRQLEHAFQENEKRHKLFLDNIADPITVFDINGCLLTINEAGAKNLGGKSEDFIGKHYTDLFPDNADIYMERNRQVIESGAEGIFEDSVELPAGKQWFWTSIKPFKDPVSQDTVIQMISHDITDRKLTEIALQESGERFRTLVENIPGVTYRCACDEHWTMEFISDEIETLAGYPASDFVQNRIRSYASIIHPDDTQVVEDTVLQGVRDNKPFSIEYRVIHSNGEVRWVFERGQGIAKPDGELSWLDGAIFDITESKQAEKMLIESEAKYSALVEKAKDGIAIASNERIVFANKALARITGYSLSELEGKFLIELMTTESAQYTVDIYHKRMSGESVPSVYQVTALRKDGTTRNVEISAGTIPYLGETASIAIIRDITKRKKAEEKLQESEEKWRSLAENAPVMITHIDPEGFIQSINHVPPITGMTADDIIGRNSIDFTAKQYQANVKEVYARVLDTGVTESHVIRGSFSDKWYYSTVGAIKKNGHITGLTVINVDITQRKQAEEAQKRLTAILESTSDLVAIATPDTRVSYMNIEGKKLVGLAPDADLANLTIPIVHPDWAYEIVKTEGIPSAIQNGVWTGETALLGPDKREIPVSQVIMSHKSQNGEVEYLSTIMRDISEIKRNEEELAKHRDRLEDLVKERTIELEAAQSELVRKEKFATLGKVTATVSHEIRNPLGTIRVSFYSIAERTRNKNLGVKKALERIERNILRCNTIIEELQNYTQVRTLELIPTYIDNWLKHETRELKIHGNLKITQKFASEIEIPLDREQFRICFVNIINNASQAMVDDTTKSKEPFDKHLIIESDVVKDRLEIKIKDTGPGIKPENMKQIFEPLYSTKGFGVGLGLPIAKQIIEQHQGGIEIDSVPGEGTTFTLWLPIKNSP